ncbi:protein of unknown function [Kyrpidia spormannii]|uniref:Uncharacterized protein n=1 Tax=Kyrpidia spormannii TaxID=2055160 RepID=A0A6F9EBG7_9BACL|nr:protein of unknown function [Kyrpidia spormannii]
MSPSIRKGAAPGVGALLGVCFLPRPAIQDWQAGPQGKKLRTIPYHTGTRERQGLEPLSRPGG